MTTAQLKSAFLRKYDAIANFAAPGYEDSEISAFLTDAQNTIFKRAVITFDRTELEKKVISALVLNFSTQVFTQTANNMPNGWVVAMPASPNEIFAAWEETAVYTGSTTPVRVKPITYDEYIINKDNPFRKPDASLMWRLDYGGAHELVTNGTAPKSYQVRYVRAPKNIDITSGQTAELNAVFHDDIVDLAVKYALATVMKVEGIRQSAQQQQKEQQ